MANILDNPSWHALNTGNKNLSSGNEAAKYFLNDVSPFVAIRENSTENLQLLHDIYPFETPVAIQMMEAIEMPACWNVLNRFDVIQMVLNKTLATAEPDDEIVPLTEKHVPEMLELTALTNPGPFEKNTIRFGHYQGIFSENRLLAMAGQRLHPVPYAEISAVCTHPSATGRGLARRLILSQVSRMQRESFIPILHVKAENDIAINLYKNIGFEIRRAIFIYFIEKSKKGANRN